MWLEAGELLTAVATERQTGDSVWLSAECGSDLDPDLQARLDAVTGIGLTQGFTAQNETGETVVLGARGSDTAVAYLAGKWGATVSRYGPTCLECSVRIRGSFPPLACSDDWTIKRRRR